jgi:hypothetical protein
MESVRFVMNGYLLKVHSSLNVFDDGAVLLRSII